MTAFGEGLFGDFAEFVGAFLSEKGARIMDVDPIGFAGVHDGLSKGDGIVRVAIIGKAGFPGHGAKRLHERN